MVADFILQNRTWNLPLLSLHFSRSDVQVISRISIPTNAPPDRWIWTANTNGKFSTKSAYKVASCEAQDGIPAVNSIPVSSTMWKQLWKSTLNHRHKILWWTILWNILPTKAYTSRFGPNNNPICPCCHKEDETIPHILFRCDTMKHIWGSSPWALNITNMLPHDPAHWIGSLLTNHNIHNNNLLIFASIAVDMMWKARNDIVHNCNPINLPNLCRTINNMFLEYAAVFSKSSIKNTANLHNNSNRDISWTPPPKDWIKVNYDAAVRTNFSFVSCVCRDETGHILLAASTRVDTSVPAVAEAEAAFFATRTAITLGWDSCILEGDSEIVGIALRDLAATPDWRIYHIADAASTYLSYFQFSDIQTISRTCNYLAHNLAKWAAATFFDGTIPLSTLPVGVLSEEEWCGLLPPQGMG